MSVKNVEIKSLSSINFDPTDYESMEQLVEKYAKEDVLFEGHNEDDESTMLEIGEDVIRHTTFQNNGWIRVNTYHIEDHTEEERYTGKWRS